MYVYTLIYNIFREKAELDYYRVNDKNRNVKQFQAIKTYAGICSSEVGMFYFFPF